MQVKFFKCLLLVCCLLFLFACGTQQPSLKYLPQDATVLAFGDSLTFGIGVTKDKSYPAILEKLINRRVINAGTPGMETAGALQTLSPLLQEYRPNLVILCLGGNDMLRQRKVENIKTNLSMMVEQIQHAGADVLLIAVPKPGLWLSAPDFYKEVAIEYHIPVLLKILPKLESNNKYKSDALHLNEAGYALFAERISQFLREQKVVF